MARKSRRRRVRNQARRVAKRQRTKARDNAITNSQKMNTSRLMRKQNQGYRKGL